ncbi:MAG: glycosyltransferase [Chloroflexi bacterium]|nr:glycosyltransferase [Chloroflexota bacterium]
MTGAPTPLLTGPAVAALLQPLGAPPAAPLPAQIVYWGLADWDAPRQRSQHLAERLSQVAPVLYLREMPLSAVVRARGRGVPPTVECPSDRLTLLRPRLLSPGRLALVARANTERLVDAVRRALDPALPVVLWLSHPDHAVLIGRVREMLVCFDSLDFHAAFKTGGAAATMAAAELSLLRQADLVFTSSDALQERAHAAGATSTLVPNGVDFERFAAAATTPLPAPADLAALPRPRLLFYGTFGPWVDLALVAGIARTRPDWSIVLIGPVAGADTRPLIGLANIHQLGVRPYDTLPAYLQHTDVCLLPFVQDPLTAAVDPLKVYEYLAAGRPVVATPLPALARCGDLIERVTSAPEAVAVIARLLAAPPDDAARRRRLAFAAEQTWAARGAVVTAAIAARLESLRVP